MYIYHTYTHTYVAFSKEVGITTESIILWNKQFGALKSSQDWNY